MLITYGISDKTKERKRLAFTHVNEAHFLVYFQGQMINLKKNHPSKNVFKIQTLDYTQISLFNFSFMTYTT